MRTAWGYEVDGDLSPIITVTQFNEMTNNAYSDNPRAEAAVKAASQAIRNYCGWHICPSLDCVASPAGGGIIAKLPAAYVGAVTKVTEDEKELGADDYKWRADGLLKRSFPYKWSEEWGAITVEYTAGYDSEAVSDLAEAVCAVASGVLAVSAGIISESADGVSISYSANASSIAASLTSQQKGALDPYKVVSSHAA